MKDIVDWLNQTRENVYGAIRCDEAADDIVQLRQDKAELLNALKHIVHWHDQLSMADIDKAKKAIAKATGGE